MFSLLTYHPPFNACRMAVSLPKSWKIGHLLLASQTLFLLLLILSNYRSIWAKMQRGTRDWYIFFAWGKGNGGFWLCHNKSTRPPIRFCSILMNPLPPPQFSLAVNLLWFLPLNSVRDDLFPFRPHWKSYDHLQNPFSLLHLGDKLWLVS